MTDSINTDVQTRLQWSLLSLRLGVFIVMVMWTLDVLELFTPYTIDVSKCRCRKCASTSIGMERLCRYHIFQR